MDDQLIHRGMLIQLDIYIRVCAVLDNIDFPEVLGTLAGDDTILVIAKSESDAVSLINKLNSLR